MKDIFDLNNRTIVATDRSLRLVILWEASSTFTLNIVDLKNKFNQLDICFSVAPCDRMTALVFAEEWLEEIRKEIWVDTISLEESNNTI